ncbi:hypothetical protein Glove_118g10 [Diversispora epigaea]|uniref:Uncharacterized protein n=1 Tax=Diversispora epigaea TaxID=1348612 RepID=A0A397J3N5_9GLOM|nr:hypothetical protein Glove_118g10 [Diversispora epigaea]
MKIGYNNIIGLKVLKAINSLQELTLYYIREEIEKNLEKPSENMRCETPRLIYSKCDEFVNSFNKTNTPNNLKNITHDKTWKENEFKLEKVASRVLSILGKVWNNAAFETSTSRNEQSEETYISDIIMLLLRASLGDLPNGYIFLSTAERQSLVSKARVNNRTGKEKWAKNLILWH